MQVYQAENQHDRAGRRGDADLLASGESGDQVTAGSIHVASAGRNWQTVACGFAGFRVRNGQMILDMHPAWLEHRRLSAQLAWQRDVDVANHACTMFTIVTAGRWPFGPDMGRQ